MPTTLTEFRNRFSLEEKRRIYSAAKVSVDVQIYLDDLASAGERGVDPSSPGTVAGVKAMVAAGLVAPEREAEILHAGSGIFAEAHGFHTGQKVRVLKPFDRAFPDVQTVDSFTEDAVQLEGGSQFAPKFLEALDGPDLI